MFSLHLQCTERRLKKYYISFMLDYFLLRGGLIARYVILDFVVVGICLSSVKMLVCLFSIASEIIIYKDIQRVARQVVFCGPSGHYTIME